MDPANDHEKISMFKQLIIGIALLGLFFFSADAQTRRRKGPMKWPVSVRAAVLSGAVRTPSGLTYLITQKGTGNVRPRKGQTVSVHYTGLLTSGVKFDSSRDRNEPISFPIGMGKVIRGWDEGISELRVGDQAILVIPPKLGYGARGADSVIPPNAKLIFIVELVDIKD